MKFPLSQDEYREVYKVTAERTLKAEKHTKTVRKFLNILIYLAVMMLITQLVSRQQNPLLAEYLSIGAFSALCLHLLIYAVLFVRLIIFEKQELHVVRLCSIKSMKAELAHSAAPYSENTKNEIISVLGSEKNRFRRAYALEMLFDHRLETGDTEGAGKTLRQMNDPGLFAADRFYELIYLCDAVCYYAVIHNVSAADEAYRAFEKAILAYPEGKDAYTVNEYALNVLANYAKAHGEWLKCYEYLDCSVTDRSGREVVFRSSVINDALTDLGKAECMYELGEYEAARILCDKSDEVLSHTENLTNKADALKKKIGEKL